LLHIPGLQVIDDTPKSTELEAKGKKGDRFDETYLKKQS